LHFLSFINLFSAHLPQFAFKKARGMPVGSD
jgi:hypothetical protein